MIKKYKGKTNNITAMSSRIKQIPYMVGAITELLKKGRKEWKQEIRAP